MEQPYSDTNAGLHYDLRLDLNPAAQRLSVSGSIAYHSPMPRLERARFYLHRQLIIQRLEGRRVAGYNYDILNNSGIPALPHAAVLDVYFDPPLGSGDTVLIQLAYAGTITEWAPDSTSVLTAEWAELGMAMPWFPMQHDSGPSELTFTLKVNTPAGFQVASLGQPSFVDGNWYYNWPHPTTDIVVAAGTALESHQFASAPNHVLVHAATFGGPAAARLGEDMLWALERFAGWFGPVRPSDFTLIESPRPLGGGYSRRGLVVLNGVTERDYTEQHEAYLRYLCHEAAHAWWWQAPTTSWEDWLNESFAEYAALLALRERFGEETYERFLARKRERAMDGAPLYGFPRADGSSPEKQAEIERQLYDCGPLLLHGLSSRIGYPRFLELCRAMLWSGVTTTTHFLDLLEELEDQPTRAWMEEQIRGGAPENGSR